jgi:hypothetical protein
MSRLDQLDALGQPGRARRNVVVARHDQAGQERIGRPQRVQRLRHRAAGLTGAQHQRAAVAGGAGRCAPMLASGSARSTATR